MDTAFRTLPGSESRSPIAEVSGSRRRRAEKAKTPGRVDLEGDGRGNERQPVSPLTAAAQLPLLLLPAPRRQGCGDGDDQPSGADGTVKALRRRRSSSSCRERRALHLSAAFCRRRSNLLDWRHVGGGGAGAPLLPPARSGSCGGTLWSGGGGSQVCAGARRPAPLALSPSRVAPEQNTWASSYHPHRLPPRHQARRRNTPPSHG